MTWTIAEIRMLFDGVGIAADLTHNPLEKGERRRLVEQHYHGLDLTDPSAVSRLVSAYAEILQRTLATSGQSTATGELVSALRRDGYIYDEGALRPATPRARLVLEQHDPKRTVSEITRRSIADVLTTAQGGWSGRLSETELLARLYDLRTLPSADSRFDTMEGDIWQHRENNNDWPDNWVFTDERLNLLNGPDEPFLRFVSETLHPTARPAIGEGEALAKHINEHLAHDGWVLAIQRRISGRPAFAAQRINPTIELPSTQVENILSDDYVRELSEKCDARLASGDLDGAVTVARTLLEAVLSELEYRLAGQRGDHKGDLPKQFKAVAKLLRLDDERPELDERFKDVVRGLVAVVSGLAPLRNRISDGHARARRPAPHHVRVVINAARTVSMFLVESYGYQLQRGLLPRAT